MSTPMPQRHAHGVSRLLPWVGATMAAVLTGIATARVAESFELPAFAFLGGVLGLTVMILFAQLGLVVLLAWPALAALAYPFVRYPSDGTILTFDRIWLAGLLAVLATTTLTQTRAPQSRRFLFALASLVVIYALRMVLPPGATVATIGRTFDALLIPLVLFLVTTRYATTQARAQRVAAALAAGGMVLAAIGLVVRVTGIDLATQSGGSVIFQTSELVRVSGPYSAPEPFALALVVCLGATIYWTLATRRFAFGAILAFAQFAAIAMTLFRAGVIAALIVLLFGLGVRPKGAVRTAVVGLALGAITLFSWMQLSSSEVVRERVDNTDNIYGRLATYEQGVEIFKTAPVIGVGIERYHFVAEERSPEYVNNVASVTYAHSDFNNVLVELGLVGFGALFFLLFAVVSLIRRLQRLADTPAMRTLAAAAAGVGLGFLVMSSTLTMLPYSPSNQFLAVFFGIVSAQLDRVHALSRLG